MKLNKVFCQHCTGWEGAKCVYNVFLKPFPPPPPPVSSSVPIYTPGWREAVRVTCHSQELNKMSPARAGTRAAQRAH